MSELIEVKNGRYIQITEMPDNTIELRGFCPSNTDIDGHEYSYKVESIRFSKDAIKKILPILKKTLGS